MFALTAAESAPVPSSVPAGILHDAERVVAQVECLIHHQAVCIGGKGLLT